jgi:signal transduction histidine kinase
VFLQVERADGDVLITPAKVWGRFSPEMFRTHRVQLAGHGLLLGPASVGHEDPGAYAKALADKNRELAEIRDALDRSNRALQQRNRELEELNARLAEQGRLYASLRTNLDQLLRLVQAGQAIGSTLVLDQVQESLLAAAARLFDAPACRLSLSLPEHAETVRVSPGLSAEWLATLDQPRAVSLASAACRDLTPAAIPLDGPAPAGSLAVAPIVLRDKCLGALEIAAPDGRLATDEGLTLLTYLASQASLALDNALLYQEVETQGEQLRSYVENVMTTEEQESRRLALDLHDGLVQMIVASYQHLQTAQAWRDRDPDTEEREVQQGTQLLRRAIHEARRLITQLRPAGLDDLGLVHALRLYIAQLTTDADWHVTLDLAPDWVPLPGPVEAALFRIVQEATTNARKYSQAPEVDVRLWRDDRELHVAITDCGVGFDPNAVRARPYQGSHMGLVGIRERARLWGGSCAITSRPGVGTRVQVSIPLARVATQAEAAHD